jgi:hypothetical protein
MSKSIQSAVLAVVAPSAEPAPSAQPAKRPVSAAFAAGLAAGQTEVNRVESAAQGIADALASMPADFELTVATYATLRAEWVAGYAEGFGCTEKRAQNAWAEVWRAACDAFGFAKPQSERALAAQAQRAPQVQANKAGKAAQKAAAEAAKAALAPVPPIKGAEAAKRIKIEVIAIEAHIIDLFRRGKFGDVITIMHSEAEKAEARK